MVFIGTTQRLVRFLEIVESLKREDVTQCREASWLTSLPGPSKVIRRTLSCASAHLGVLGETAASVASRRRAGVRNECPAERFARTVQDSSSITAKIHRPPVSPCATKQLAAWLVFTDAEGPDDRRGQRSPLPFLLQGNPSTTR